MRYRFKTIPVKFSPTKFFFFFVFRINLSSLSRVWTTKARMGRTEREYRPIKLLLFYNNLSHDVIVGQVKKKNIKLWEKAHALCVTWLERATAQRKRRVYFR